MRESFIIVDSLPFGIHPCYTASFLAMFMNENTFTLSKNKFDIKGVTSNKRNVRHIYGSLKEEAIYVLFDAG